MLARTGSVEIGRPPDELPGRQGPDSGRRSSVAPFRRASGLCAGCGALSAGGRRACPHGRREDAAGARSSARGRLETFVIVRQALPGYSGPIPYAIGAIMLPGGLRLRAILSGYHPEELEAGMEVELGPVKICESRPGTDGAHAGAPRRQNQDARL